MSVTKIGKTKTDYTITTIKVNPVNNLQLSMAFPWPTPLSRKQARHSQDYKIFKEQISTTLYKHLKKIKKTTLQIILYVKPLYKTEQVR